MSKDSILGGSKIMAFVHITDWARARAFYQEVLGLRLVEEEKPFALVFDANGIMLARDSRRRAQTCAWHGAGLGGANPSKPPSSGSGGRR